VDDLATWLRGPIVIERLGYGAMLRLLRDGRPRSRSELAARSGTTRAIVTQRLGALVATGLVTQEAERSPTGSRHRRRADHGRQGVHRRHVLRGDAPGHYLERSEHPQRRAVRAGDRARRAHSLRYRDQCAPHAVRGAAMNRPLGASTFIWVSPFADTELQLASHVRELGFDVLEVCVEQADLLTGAAVSRAAEDNELGISVCGAFGRDRDASDPDPRTRSNALDYLKRCIELAAAVGSPHVAGAMYAAGVFAAEAGVRLAMEPLNRYESDLVNTVDQGLELCDLVGLPNLGLMLDTYHMNIEERSIADAIVRAGDRCFHFQASENDRGTPGAGHVPWAEVFAALDRIGYAGPVVIESFVPSIKEIARAVSLWRPVAASPDDLARDGLAFLRRFDGGA